MEPWRALRPVGREAGPRLLLALFGLWFYFWRGRIVLWTVRSLLRQLRFQRSSPWHPRTCPTVLTGMTAVVTGANSGLGKQVALELVRRGARVVLACRDLTRGQEALDDIRAATGCGPQRLLLREVDLSSLASVRAFAARLLAELPEIHLLVNNAGIPGLPARTPDGLNVTLATNYLGPFLLTNLLLIRLRGRGAPEPGRRPADHLAVLRLQQTASGRFHCRARPAPAGHRRHGKLGGPGRGGDQHHKKPFQDLEAVLPAAETLIQKSRPGRPEHLVLLLGPGGRGGDRQILRQRLHPAAARRPRLRPRPRPQHLVHLLPPDGPRPHAVLMGRSLGPLAGPLGPPGSPARPSDPAVEQSVKEEKPLWNRPTWHPRRGNK
ncbi:uncharacterized protein LOC100078778 isoform X2 [Ornithorhynchus anatinus]|uniref:uncharacterized protein LOC100078778 isoform X2 n=1 Tax=Ornithorhynchus anatinus TaxID=9258 RepID=UPI0010A92835|nr:uncharacterized protein LOC100078778 isoform X2 [Ornithorhynchus anatinus]